MRINKYKQKHIPKCFAVKVHAHMTTPTFLDVLRTTRACLKIVQNNVTIFPLHQD